MKLTSDSVGVIVDSLFRGKPKHMLERLSRYHDESIEPSNIEATKVFLSRFVNDGESFFSYFKLPRRDLFVSALPEYISYYTGHLIRAIERRKVSNYLGWPLPMFVADEDQVQFPKETKVYWYITRNEYTLILILSLSGVITLHSALNLDRVFDFSAVTFLDFEDTIKTIELAKFDKRMIHFNLCIEHFMGTFRDQVEMNDFSQF
jgi:hypothetical protein